MSKLKNLVSDNTGSVLVSVVALSVLMAIGTAGYMGIARNTVNHEVDALEDAQALESAESGLLIGTHWLRDTSHWNYIQIASGDYTIYNAPVGPMNVTVIVTNAAGKISVNSQARGGKLNYVKEVSWDLEKQAPPVVGTFINQMFGGGAPGNGIGTDGFNNMIFDGPFHMNRSIILSSNSKGNVLFKGEVTVYNKTQTGSAYRFKDQELFTTGDWGQYGTSNNNYDFGIHMHNWENKQGTNQAGNFDKYFEKTYLHSQDSIYLDPITYKNITELTDPIGGARPTLIFNADGTATYYYGAATPQTYPASAITDHLIVANSELNVLGTYVGGITVRASGSIYPTGELVGADFNHASLVDDDFTNYDHSRNYGIDLNSTNVLSLVTDQDIVFEPSWNDPRTGSTGDRIDAGSSANGNLYIAATLVAKGTHKWTEDGQPANSHNDYDYTRLRVIGSRILDDWETPYWAGGAAKKDDVRFFFDRRAENGIFSPGLEASIKIAGSGGGALFKLTKTWREANLALN